MGKLGMGAMLGMLGGNEKTVNTINDALNKNIVSMFIEKDKQMDSLIIEFDDKGKIRIFDDGQMCCESRYIHTDDDLSAFVPSKLIDISLRGAPNIEEDEYGTHEVQFLIIKTSLGEFTLETHNEHNGYYGGFWVVVEPLGSKTT